MRLTLTIILSYILYAICMSAVFEYVDDEPRWFKALALLISYWAPLYLFMSIYLALNWYQ